ncbi:MAG TPA: hypothetical protein PKD04_04545 [Rhodocyclaceae bacterium]|jgi:hypothetical protein|nr:hypothetical protein [Rhodocyclaceae bacterium]HMV20459.1 hypothetical protein [Rhodocyclaceae bacterium]HMW76315.1 hypothetical protein [Rhodocyclaceae bacterium]HNE44037.1 hypothetical protein [Rhodocyclaceae bacterium]HNL20450.1 hypothetical protein [Rhodocyclaceae bacterium]
MLPDLAETLAARRTLFGGRAQRTERPSSLGEHFVRLWSDKGQQALARVGQEPDAAPQEDFALIGEAWSEIMRLALESCALLFQAQAILIAQSEARTRLFDNIVRVMLRGNAEWSSVAGGIVFAALHGSIEHAESALHHATEVATRIIALTQQENRLPAMANELPAVEKTASRRPLDSP